MIYCKEINKKLFLATKLCSNKHKIYIRWAHNHFWGGNMEGYCVKCKAKREISNGKETTMKNGRKAMKGSCPNCSTGMFRILGK